VDAQNPCGFGAFRIGGLAGSNHTNNDTKMRLVSNEAYDVGLSNKLVCITLKTPLM
jgi:hypothetical protein